MNGPRVLSSQRFIIPEVETVNPLDEAVWKRSLMFRWDTMGIFPLNTLPWTRTVAKYIELYVLLLEISRPENKENAKVRYELAKTALTILA